MQHAPYYMKYSNRLGLNKDEEDFFGFFFQQQPSQKLFPDKQCGLLSILIYKLLHTNHLISIITIANKK